MLERNRVLFVSTTAMIEASRRTIAGWQLSEGCRDGALPESLIWSQVLDKAPQSAVSPTIIGKIKMIDTRHS